MSLKLKTNPHTDAEDAATRMVLKERKAEIEKYYPKAIVHHQTYQHIVLVHTDEGSAEIFAVDNKHYWCRPGYIGRMKANINRLDSSNGEWLFIVDKACEALP